MKTPLSTDNLGAILGCAPPNAEAAYIDLNENTALTLPDLDQSIARMARGLSQRFLRGSRVALLGRNGAAFIRSYLALLYAGIVAVPINYRLPPAIIEFIINDASCSAIIGDREFRSLVDERHEFLDFAGPEIGELARALAMGPVSPRPDEICEILYTSGSTGRPKGVPLSHAGQLWALDRVINAAPAKFERTVIVAPTYHMNGLFFTTMALASGWRTFSMPYFNARQMLELIDKERLTTLSGIPTMFAMMVRESDLLKSVDLSCVQTVTIGSAPLSLTLRDEISAIFPNAEVRNSYGTTESGPAMFGPHPQGKARPSLSIGYPYEGVEWKLVGEDPHCGRLLTRTPAVLREYLNLPEQTKIKISDGWYDTGDIVRCDDDGFFFYVGRADDMFVCGGENIYPAEVERLLERHPDVLQAAVVPVNDKMKGSIPIAFVEPVNGKAPSSDMLKRFALENGAAFAHPRAVVVLDKLPVGGTHKIDRKKLMSLAEETVLTLDRN